MNDRDALIERMEKVAVGGLRTIDWGEATRFKDDLRALISLVSPSPAQTRIEVGKPMPPTCAACGSIPVSGYCDLAGCPLRSSPPSPAWPEDVVERATDTFLAYFGGECRPSHKSAMRAALATLPPPEDERVKGLVEALERIGSMEAFKVGGVLDKHRDAELLARIHFARSALASYRGGA